MPAGKVWRDLDHLDLKLTDNSGTTGLFVRFYVGATASDPSPDAVLDANGIITGEVGAYDRTGNLSQLDTVGIWAVRQQR